MKKFLIIPLLMALAACCCDDDDKCDDDNGNGQRECRTETTTEPTPVSTPVSKFYTVEYRVIGTAQFADIIYSNSVHGTTELNSVLPWVLSFKTDKDRLFVSLYAKAGNPGRVRVQILVNGEIFREASSDGFFGSSAEVSGTLISPIILPLKTQR